ncbi:MAG: hypothetical protein KDD31_11220 [Muricauda sp.]|nr:hypothetical protein [Allomuricauda sp.]
MKSFLQQVIKSLRRAVSILMAAYTLGISNIILEENRMINDSRKNVEQQEAQSEDDSL